MGFFFNATSFHSPLMFRFRSYVAVVFTVKHKPFLRSPIGKLELYPKEEHDTGLT